MMGLFLDKSDLFRAFFQEMISGAPLFQYLDHQIGVENLDPCHHLESPLEEGVRKHAGGWPNDGSSFAIGDHGKDGINGVIDNGCSRDDHHGRFLQGVSHFGFGFKIFHLIRF